MNVEAKFVDGMAQVNAYHAKTAEETIRLLNTDRVLGLTEDEAGARLGQYGSNELPRAKRRSLLLMFGKQFRNGLTLILLAAAALSMVVGEAKDAAGILIAVMINVVVGFEMERRADNAVASLKDMVVPEARVIRGGQLRRIKASQLVPGDILAVREGDRVVADARLIECKSLTTDESAFTGESSAVAKSPDQVAEGLTVADMTDMVFTGTTVLSGTARAAVTATGGATSFGQIAGSLGDIRRPPTPFEDRVGHLSRIMGAISLAVVAAVLMLGLLKGFAAWEMIFLAIALAVAVIPEGLPAVLTVVMAVGVRRMARRRAIVRNLASVESLGSADVICTDKTGTLTENKMTVREVITADRKLSVTGEGWNRQGEFRQDGHAVLPTDLPDLVALLRAAALMGRLSVEQRGGSIEAIGSPTEAAMAVLAAKGGIDRAVLERGLKEIDEIPFSPERKYRALLLDVADIDGSLHRGIYVLGSYSAVSRRCGRILVGDKYAEFDDSVRAMFMAEADEMGGRALRVLTLAMKPVSSEASSLAEADVTDLAFLGLAGMIDPPRAEAKPSIEKCRRAGIRVIMITGDQKSTAIAVAREVGLLDGVGPQGVYTETEVAGLDDAAFDRVLDDAAVFARVTPLTKLRIVERLTKQGKTVAMTGDGVNDAPALKRAAVGVAMGQSGTDVARQVADVVLADDNFSSIVSAVEEGRTVYRNIKQTNAYLLSTNMAEAVTIVAAISVGLPLPILPAQILWMNLVTDGLPDMAMATEPPDAGVIEEPPRPRTAKFVSRWVLIMMALVSALMCLGTLLFFALSLKAGDSIDHARTAAFTMMALFQLWNIFNMRSATRSIWSIGWLTNRWVIWAVLASFGLQLAVVYLPVMGRAFGTVPLGIADWLILVPITFAAVPLVELLKLAARRGLIPNSWI
jgi:magnesium-transporting ATPase (P-type)